MTLRKPLQTFLFPVVNIFITIFLLWAFFIAGQNVVRTFSVANMSALNTLHPKTMDYFWDLNIHQAPLNKSRVRFYVDYYEQLLKAFPSVREAYGVLGYCYDQMGEKAKAIDYLQKAIRFNPDYSWNYYNLAAIYITEAKYDQAKVLLKKLLQLDPQKSMHTLTVSPFVYDPLLRPGGKDIIRDIEEHEVLSYRVSIELIRLLDQIPGNQKIAEAVKNINMGVYAF